MKYSDIPKKYIKYINLNEEEFNNLHEISQETFLRIAINTYNIKNKNKRFDIYSKIKINYIYRKINKKLQLNSNYI